MDILIHFASGKTKIIRDVANFNGEKYNNFQEMAQELFDVDINTFENCSVNMNYVEMIEEIETEKKEGNENDQ